LFSGRDDYEGFGGQADPNSVLLSTRKRIWIRNRQYPERHPERMRVAEQYCKNRVPEPIETRSLSAIYNCFGLVFASRRTALEREDIDRILDEDAYTFVARRADVREGDIIVYRKSPRTIPLHQYLRQF